MSHHTVPGAAPGRAGRGAWQVGESLWGAEVVIKNMNVPDNDFLKGNSSTLKGLIIILPVVLRMTSVAHNSYSAD